ncbi:MAG: VOC family protein [Actinomycetota bacterium]|nr:VOC family protein [Actinomycetota bacterium]
MRPRLDLVTLDSPDPDAAARFWCAALELVVSEREDDGRWVVLSDAAGVRRIGLQRGATRSGSVHLDLVCGVDEFDASVEHLVAEGAVALAAPRTEPYGRIVNLADPDGNPFDLCAY